jgi:hypothetical protein
MLSWWLSAPGPLLLHVRITKAGTALTGTKLLLLPLLLLLLIPLAHLSRGTRSCFHLSHSSRLSRACAERDFRMRSRKSRSSCSVPQFAAGTQGGWRPLRHTPRMTSDWHCKHCCKSCNCWSAALADHHDELNSRTSCALHVCWVKVEQLPSKMTVVNLVVCETQCCHACCYAASTRHNWCLFCFKR